jgi:dTDP-4-amino-4,6-dideoxygalactose transaminase
MIPFLDLHTLNARFEKDFKAKFSQFLDKGWYILGEEVTLFEQEYAAYCGASHCVGTANGLDALRLILEGYKALGQLKIGDEVLVASNTYIATILGVKQAGLVPVLVEAEAATFNFDFDDLARKVTSKTKVIMPTHLYGQLADMEKVTAFAKAHALVIVTDAAQSHGAKNKDGKSSGGLADASGHSFYPTKNLGALGDGGAVTTNDAALADMIKKLRNYGFEERYVSKYVGLNSRLDEIQAAFLRIKLPALDADNENRRAIARRYFSEVENSKLILPIWDGTDRHVFHLFVVRTADRDQLALFLKEQGIGTIIHYPIPPHKQEALQQYRQLSFPVTEQMHNEVLSIPIGPMMTDTQVSAVITALNAY